MALCVLLMTRCKEPQLAQKPNVLLICVDDLRPELKSFGTAHIFSPNIDRLAQEGISFQKHYVNVKMQRQASGLPDVIEHQRSLDVDKGKIFIVQDDPEANQDRIKKLEARMGKNGSA